MRDYKGVDLLLEDKALILFAVSGEVETLAAVSEPSAPPVDVTDLFAPVLQLAISVLEIAAPPTQSGWDAV